METIQRQGNFHKNMDYAGIGHNFYENFFVLLHMVYLFYISHQKNLFHLIEALNSLINLDIIS